MAYMTDCQGSCTEFQPAMDTPWFKIDEAGLKPGTANDWVQKDIRKFYLCAPTEPSRLMRRLLRWWLAL